MFGNSKPPQNEKTKFIPQSIYAISKVFAFNCTANYRDAYKIHASNGILFNHESPRRGPNFVTKKIVQGLVRIKRKEQKILTLGNIYTKRDWGHAKDYVESMWKILQQKKPDDYVIGTNKSISVKRFVELTAKKIGIKIKWQGKGLNEIGINLKDNKTIIKIDKKYFRPTEVNYLVADFKKAKKILGWKPKYDINNLIEDMIKNEK